MPVRQPALHLLGSAHAVVADADVKLERKDALLFAWLAVEGPTARARLASLLFPETDDTGARGALRQRMYRLRRSALASLLAGEDPIALAAGVEVDLADAAAPGDLLSGVRADDVPELAAWLDAQRERRKRVRIETGLAASDRAQAAGDLPGAIAAANAALDADPLFEPAHRRLMTLHYLHGDVASARAAYERLREVLKRELGAAPARETEDLRRQMEGGTGLPAAPRAMPMTVLRPPRLIGRASEWSHLVAAWQAGAAAVVSGEPGLGKSRLVGDLVRGVSGALLVSARPGDRNAPYAVLARLLRALLPAVKEGIAPGVNKELARLLPELGDAEPMKSPADQARFLSAIEVLLGQAVSGGVTGIAVDDVQYADAATAEALQHLSGRNPGLAWLAAYRTGELSAAGQALVDTLTKGRETCAIALAPLALPQIVELIESLAIADLDAAELAPPLARRTGGNPFFLLEAIKSMLAQDQPNAGALPVATSVGALIERRIARLSPEAVRLARCAAVAGQDHSIDLAAKVLGVRPLDLADAWTELETAQVLRDGAFAHDLVYEAALASVPPPIAQHLHGEIAAYLMARGSEPSRVALHFEAARQPEPAAQWWVKAGHAAERALRYAEAADGFERGARLLGECGMNKQAFDAAYLMRLACFEVDLAERSNAALALLDRFATTPAQRARAHNEHAVTRLHRGEMAETERHALGGLAALGGADEPMLRAELRRNLAAVLAWRNDTAAALREMRSVQADVERVGTPDQRFQLYDSLSILLSHADECAEATVMAERAVALAIELGNLPGAAQVVLNLAVHFFDSGDARRAMSALERARNLLAAVGDDATPYSSLHLNYGLAMRALGDYASALEHFDRAMPRARLQTPGWVPLVAAGKAQTLTYLGQFARAQQTLAADAPDERTPPLAVNKWQTAQHLLAHAQGRVPGSVLVPIIERYPARGRQIVRWRLQAADLAGREADAASLERALQLAQQAEAATRHGVAIHLHARAAACARKQQQGDVARREARAALALMNEHSPDDIYPGEVAQVAIATLREGDADDQAEAKAALRKVVAWIEQTAAERVPAEFRDSFLTRNAANRALLTSASRELRE